MGQIHLDRFYKFCIVLYCVQLGNGCTSCPSSLTEANIGSGTYYEALEISLTANPPAEIYCSLGRETFERCNSPVVILKSGELKFFSINRCGSREKTREESYIIESPFHETTSMSVKRFNHTSTTLNDGNVLIAGGAPYALDYAVSIAEIYDIDSGTFFSTYSMNSPRNQHTGTLLMDGSVLIAGGNFGHYITTLSSAELYITSSRSFYPTAGMSWPRFNHTSTLLNDGTVLVAGGATVTWENSSWSPDINNISSVEIFSPSSRTFSSIGPMNVARMGHTATLLTDGTVLIAGGGYSGLSPTSSAEIYDPITKSFTLTKGSMNEERIFHSAVLLNDGRVLITGGGDSISFTNTAELYNPLTDTFTYTTKPLNEARGLHASILLGDGRVLITGGTDIVLGNVHYSAEIYDPSVGDFIPIKGPMTSRRSIHTMSLINGGRILICGGLVGMEAIESCEVYDPNWKP